MAKNRPYFKTSLYGIFLIQCTMKNDTNTIETFIKNDTNIILGIKMGKTKVTQEDRDKIVQMILDDGIEYKEEYRSDLRYGGIQIITQYSEKLRGTSKNDISIIKDDISTIIELSEREQQIIDLLEQDPKSIKEIKTEIGMSTGSVWNYLKMLQVKGLVQKERISHKNVIYSRI